MQGARNAKSNIEHDLPVTPVVTCMVPRPWTRRCARRITLFCPPLSPPSQKPAGGSEEAFIHSGPLDHPHCSARPRTKAMMAAQLAPSGAEAAQLADGIWGETMWPGWCNLTKKKKSFLRGRGNIFFRYILRSVLYCTYDPTVPTPRLCLLEEWVTIAPNVAACMLGAYVAGLLFSLQL